MKKLLITILIALAGITVSAQLSTNQKKQVTTMIATDNAKQQVEINWLRAQKTADSLQLLKFKTAQRSEANEANINMIELGHKIDSMVAWKMANNTATDLQTINKWISVLRTNDIAQDSALSKFKPFWVDPKLAEVRTGQLVDSLYTPKP